MKRVSPTDSGVLNLINGVLDIDPRYQSLHKNTMHVHWHQKMKSKNMRVGMINNIG